VRQDAVEHTLDGRRIGHHDLDRIDRGGNRLGVSIHRGMAGFGVRFQQPASTPAAA